MSISEVAKNQFNLISLKFSFQENHFWLHVCISDIPGSQNQNW